ncbi:hypothetical protein [Mycobacterium leprae]|uniref:hypothetical protein n=1 Tax=Mycobacterium leprae TaxID=1769 RepID=UPI000314A6EC|nr:hypothetical protein [Mycobacterium leprae]
MAELSVSSEVLIASSPVRLALGLLIGDAFAVGRATLPASEVPTTVVLTIRSW